jgi:hypothetical protein
MWLIYIVIYNNNACKIDDDDDDDADCILYEVIKIKLKQTFIIGFVYSY